MMGSDGDGEGMIPRAMRWLFDVLGSDDAFATTVSVSYCEIHNERLMDLLGPSKAPLEIRESGQHGDAIHVPGMTVVEVKKTEEVMEVLAVGSAQRSLAATDMNEHSSRSHTIFQCYVERIDAEHSNVVSMAKFSLVDLAGSEKFKIHRSSSFNAERVEELKAINKSLSCLGACIAALCEGKKRAHIPYRNSKLTRLLQDCLGGNTRTVMVVTLSPSAASYDETISTLQFADRAMKVQVTAKPNRVLLTDCAGGRHDDADDGGVAAANQCRAEEELAVCKQEIAHLRQMVQYLVEQADLPLSSPPASLTAQPPTTATATTAGSDGSFDHLVKRSATAREMEDAEASVAWLRQYHSWLLSDAQTQYEEVKSRSGGDVIPIAEADKLYDRICMMETSILVQAAELQRAKNLFAQTNAELQDKHKAAKRDVYRLQQLLAERDGDGALEGAAMDAEAVEEGSGAPDLDPVLEPVQQSLFEGAPRSARSLSLGAVYDFLKPAPANTQNNENSVNACNADAVAEHKMADTKADLALALAPASSASAPSAPTPKPRTKKALWRVVHDPTTNGTYYYNRVTKSTTWDRPSIEELNAFCE